MTMYALKSTPDMVVIRYEDFTEPPPTLAPEKNLIWVPEDMPMPAPPVPPALTLADYEMAVQNHLDATARMRGYENILSACSYSADPNVGFAADGATAIAWRSEVWIYCYNYMSSGQIPTSMESFIASLPAITWPLKPI